MKLHRIALALLIVCSLGATVPVMAQQADPRSGNLVAPVPTGGDDMQGGDNTNKLNSHDAHPAGTKNATDPAYKCYRRDSTGDVEFVCPKDMEMMK